jgi:hypothetical protein
MRIIGIILMLICLTVSVSARTVTGKTTTKKKLNPAVVQAQIKQLQALLKKDAAAMHKLRIKLLKTDPELKKMHESIMAMHRELALKMAANKQMQTLIMSFDKTSGQVRKLKKSLTKKVK